MDTIYLVVEASRVEAQYRLMDTLAGRCGVTNLFLLLLQFKTYSNILSPQKVLGTGTLDPKL